MYVYAYDKHAGAMVGVLGRPFAEEVDNQRLLESITRHQGEAQNPKSTGVFVLVVDPQYPQPNAKWRRRFAEARDGLVYAKMLFAVVTPETALRGVLTAVNWIRPPTARFEAETFATFEEALRWAEERRGSSSKPLQMLMNEVQEKLSSTTDGISSGVSSTRPRNLPPPTEKPHTTK